MGSDRQGMVMRYIGTLLIWFLLANCAWAISLANFGAVGDGTTDDGPAFQRMFDFGEANNVEGF